MATRQLSELKCNAAQRRELAARERLGAVIEMRKHLECMVTEWTGKLATVQKHLEDAKANLEKARTEEQQLRETIIPTAIQKDKDTRKAELLAEMERMKEQLARLDASEL